MIIPQLIIFLPLIAAIIVGLNTSMNFRLAQIITTAAVMTAAVLSFITFNNVVLQGHVYNITLPSSITMTPGDGVGTTKQRVVNSFTSSPSGTGT